MGIYRWLVGYTSRYSYWSNSKFAELLRKWWGHDPHPKAATARGWCDYEKNNKTKFGYWFIDNGLDILQNVAYFPKDLYRNIRRYVKNRFIDKPWCLNTKLSKGDWHEFDTRVTHGLFETLVDFVEQEKAHMQYISEEIGEDKEVERIYPSREKGLEYLDWEISLREESSLQAATAKETKELYLWWKDVRPNRPDPYEVSGWSAYCEDQRQKGEGFWCSLDDEDETEEERKRVMDMIHHAGDIENQYEDEDTEMLIRLIKIRRGLWT